MKSLKGLALGIGSLPHKNPDAALDLVFKYLPQIPFWPQLPKRDAREGMVAQFTEHLACKESDLEVFYERLIANDLEYFKISPEAAFGLYKFLTRPELKKAELIKAHITGPFTFAAGIKDESGKALLSDPALMQAVIKGLSMKALWQMDLLKKFGKKVIMFLDEPYLGCFGSAYTPINREDVVKGLSELAAPLKAQGALVGVHCCGNTDWSIFTDTKEIDIINFDAFGFFEKLALYSDNLKRFFGRGGILCWGIVPTQEFSDKITAQDLVAKINSCVDVLVKKGLDRKLVLDQLLISPACGLGSLDEARAEKILKLLSETSAILRRGEK